MVFQQVNGFLYLWVCMCVCEEPCAVVFLLANQIFFKSNQLVDCCFYLNKWSRTNAILFESLILQIYVQTLASNVADWFRTNVLLYVKWQIMLFSGTWYRNTSVRWRCTCWRLTHSNVFLIWALVEFFCSSLMKTWALVQAACGTTDISRFCYNSHLYTYMQSFTESFIAGSVADLLYVVVCQFQTSIRLGVNSYIVAWD